MNKEDAKKVIQECIDKGLISVTIENGEEYLSLTDAGWDRVLEKSPETQDVKNAIGVPDEWQ
jgi:predicted transcriptional regulator